MLDDEDGHPELARKSLEQVLVLDPNSATALTQLGQIELAAKNYPRSAELLERSLKLRPDAGAAFDAGRAEFGAGNLTAARDALEQSLKLSTGQYDGHTLLGRVYVGLKQWEKAQDQLEAAVFLDGSRPEARVELARVLLAKKQPEQAIAQLQSAIKNGAGADAYDVMAAVYTEMGKSAVAAQAASRARALRSKGRPAQR
jgi:tetratricopeptide (TPR) repeat protein